MLLNADGRPCHASAGAWQLLLMAAGGASRASLADLAQLPGGPLLQALQAQLQRRPDATAQACCASTRASSAPQPDPARARSPAALGGAICHARTFIVGCSFLFRKPCFDPAGRPAADAKRKAKAIRRRF